MSDQGGSKNTNYEKTRLTIRQFVDTETLYGSSDSLFRRWLQLLQPWVNFNAFGSADLLFNPKSHLNIMVEMTYFSFVFYIPYLSKLCPFLINLLTSSHSTHNQLLATLLINANCSID